MSDLLALLVPPRRSIRWAPVLVIVALAGAMAIAQAPPPSPAAPAARSARETRGLWVLRTSLTSAAAIEQMVSRAAAGGYNTLLVQVRGRGDAYYRSEVEPRAADLGAAPADFDPLATTIAVAHRAGLEVHAWVNVNLVSSAVTLPRDPSHVIRRHPEWLMVPEPLAARLHRMNPRSPAYLDAIARWTRTSSPRVEGLFLSPMTEPSQAYTERVVRDLVARYDLDGLHFDYIRYPGAAFDYSAGALAAFRAARLPQVAEADRRRLDAASHPAAWARAFPAAWIEFRQARLTALVSRLVRAARDARPSLVISAAVVPDADEARAHRFQDWPGWVSTGLLDVVCPMMYTPDATLFAAQARAMREILGDAPMWAGIGAYRLPVARTAEHLRAARRAGAEGVLLFSYDSLTGPDAPSRGYLMALRPALVEVDGGGRLGR